MKCMLCERERIIKENPQAMIPCDAIPHTCNQPERSKREDFYQQLAKEYLDTQEYWETDSDERISIKCFAIWLDKRCGALNSMET